MLKNDPKSVTLSFDNGPDAQTTPLVLDVLERRGVKATFFVIGRKLVFERAPAERAAAEGHWIGNHTWSHSTPFRENSDIEFVRSEIGRAQSALGALAHPDKLFRPYGGGGRRDGVLSEAAAAHLALGGFTCVLWNTVPGDWRDPDGWVDVALREMDRSAWPLVVLHDFHAGAMRHLDRFIGELQDRGHGLRQDFPPDCVALRCGIPTPIMAEAFSVPEENLR